MTDTRLKVTVKIKDGGYIELPAWNMKIANEMKECYDGTMNVESVKITPISLEEFDRLCFRDR